MINKANTAIGRALRLCLINIGYCKAGAGDPNFIGLPTKFGMCIAENEEVSPWQPYHVDKGFRADESAVTVITVTGPTDILDNASRNHLDTLNNIASMMFYRHAGGGSWIKGRQSAQVGHTNQRVEYQGPYHPIMLSPSRAVILAEAGFSKRDAQEWLHEHCRASLRDAIGAAGVPTDANGKWLHHPELQHLADDPDATIPALEDPEQYLLFVTGGSTHYANFFYGTYGIATRPVERTFRGARQLGYHWAVCGPVVCLLPVSGDATATMMITQDVNDAIVKMVYEDLAGRFKGELEFGPIDIQQEIDQYGDPYLHIRIVFDGDQSKLDSKWTSRPDTAPAPPTD